MTKIYIAWPLEVEFGFQNEALIQICIQLDWVPRSFEVQMRETSYGWHLVRNHTEKPQLLPFGTRKQHLAPRITCRIGSPE